MEQDRAVLAEQLCWASRRGEAAETSRLLDLGAPLEVATPGGWTPLFWASCGGYLTVVDILVSRGANVLAQDSNGMNPLHLAALHGFLDIVKVLAQHRAAAIFTRDASGRDPLLLASLWGNYAVCEFLISQKADPRKRSRWSHSALTHFGLYCLRSTKTEEEKAELKAQLKIAWLKGPHPDAKWARRRNFMKAIVGSKLRPMARDLAAQKQIQATMDLRAPLPGIPRRTEEEKWAYLLKEVFGHDGIVRCIVEKM